MDIIHNKKIQNNTKYPIDEAIQQVLNEYFVQLPIVLKRNISQSTNNINVQIISSHPIILIISPPKIYLSRYHFKTIIVQMFKIITPSNNRFT
jgi:hypothetical protein